MKLSSILLLFVLIFISCGGKKIDNKTKVNDEDAAYEQARNFENAQKYDKAYEAYQSIVEKFPDSPNRYKALFMVGYIQLEYLKDSPKAARTFETLIKQYPDCDLAGNAKIMKEAATSGRDLDSIFQDSLNSNK